MDIKQTAQQIRERYSNDPRSTTFNAIIYGGSGTGKTYSIRTMRAPILVHSFDPGGTHSVRDLVEGGTILIDNQFEVEDPKNPSAFRKWDTEYHKLKREGFFNSLGTYVIDSLTTWASCALGEVMRRDKRAGGTPQQNDWLPQMQILENAMRDFLSLPCDVVLIGHDDVMQDAISGKMFSSLMITGKLKKRIPLLFDEVYYSTTKVDSKGTHYYFQTQADSRIQARSRLANKGQLETLEPPDFKAILKKVGMDYEDKELI